MKKVVSLALFLMIPAIVFAQKKNKTQEPVTDPKLDSLIIVSKVLTDTNDSLTTSNSTYFGVYMALKDKLFKKDFDPAKTSILLDSALTPLLKFDAADDSIRNYFVGSLEMLKEQLGKANAKLDSMTNESMQAKTLEESRNLDREMAISQLKSLKELLDANIITQTEYSTAKKKYLEKL